MMMKSRLPSVVILPLCLGLLAGCDRIPVSDFVESFRQSKQKPVENITPETRDAAAKLKTAEDPIAQKVNAFILETRQSFNNRRFDELETKAGEIRASKAVFENGAWKIVHFYESLECVDGEPESLWKLHDEIYRAWIAAKPNSITARVAYASFLVNWAWEARGSGYANTVSETGWRLFAERLASAHRILDDARRLPSRDPALWWVGMRVALGEGWPKAQYDVWVEEATKFEPTFWNYDTARAYSLLPRWHGEPGDWEAYAMKAAERPDGAGAEAYTRIVLHLRRFYENILRDSEASWPKTKEGLKQMLEKYPDSKEVLSNAALLATLGNDREMAKEMFDRLGDFYLPKIWRKPERFIHYKTWAETGEWR